MLPSSALSPPTLSPSLPTILHSRSCAFLHTPAPRRATLVRRHNKRMRRARFIFIKELIFIRPRVDSFLLVHLPPRLPFPPDGALSGFTLIFVFEFDAFLATRHTTRRGKTWPFYTFFPDTAFLCSRAPRHSFVPRGKKCIHRVYTESTSSTQNV